MFLEAEQVIFINQVVITRFGGLNGIRDKGLLESAIANPQNLYFYNNADIFNIASSYAVSIIKNHPFLDGNKRTGFASMNAFLELNDTIINFPEDETVEMMIKVATSEVDVKSLALWLKDLSNLMKV
jgi:death on curing protein